MAKAKKADKVNPEQKTPKYVLVNLFKFRTLNGLLTCEAKDMNLPHGLDVVNPDDKVIGNVEEIHARWLAVKDPKGQVWVGLDDFTLALQGAPLDARGRYMKRTADNKPIKHGFQFCHVRVVPDENGKPTGTLYQQ